MNRFVNRIQNNVAVVSGHSESRREDPDLMALDSEPRTNTNFRLQIRFETVARESVVFSHVCVHVSKDKAISSCAKRV